MTKKKPENNNDEMLVITRHFLNPKKVHFKTNGEKIELKHKLE